MRCHGVGGQLNYWLQPSSVFQTRSVRLTTSISKWTPLLGLHHVVVDSHQFETRLWFGKKKESKNNSQKIRKTRKSSGTRSTTLGRERKGKRQPLQCRIKFSSVVQYQSQFQCHANAKMRIPMLASCCILYPHFGEMKNEWRDQYSSWMGENFFFCGLHGFVRCVVGWFCSS